jgi:hypothetical protein
MQRLTLCLAFGSAAALTLSPRVAHPRAGRIVATGDVNIKVKRPDAGAIEAKRAEEAAAQLEEVRAGCSSFVPTMAARLAPDVVLPSSADALQAALEGDSAAAIYRSMYEVRCSKSAVFQNGNAACLHSRIRARCVRSQCQIDFMLLYEENDGQITALADVPVDTTTKQLMRSMYQGLRDATHDQHAG